MVFLLGVLSLALPVHAQESRGGGPPDQVGQRPDSHRVAAATSRITVDGVLDEPAWATALAMRLRYEWQPGDNTAAPVDTECLVTYDATNLYLACRAHDHDPDAIRAYLGDRDTRFDDDHIVILLDTFNDQRRAFQFRVNSLGIQMDALTSGSFEDFSWDAIWDSAGRITADGYVVEVAIPFKSLSFQPTESAQTWGLILERSWPRSIRHRMRQVRTDRNDRCTLCQADRIVGFGGVSPGRDVELNPTLTTGRTDERDSLLAPKLATGDLTVDPGLNVRWRVTPNLSFDATLNPDFSQVEADAARLEVNRRFALFFDEKRPFFLEGADLFDIRGDLVFTRTVVDPVAGAKLTGKIGDHAVGLFVTHDEVNSLIFPGPRESDRTLVEDNVTAATLRYRRDVGVSSTVGLAVTDRESSGYHNRLVATDGDLRIGRSNAFRFLVAHSSTDYPDGIARAFGQPVGSLTGQTYFGELRHDSRNWSAFVAYRHVEPQFRADAGFVPQVGIRGPEGRVQYTIWGSADRWFSEIQLELRGERLEDFDGRLTEQRITLETTWDGPLQSRVSLDLDWRKQLFGGRTFDLRVQDLFLRIRPSGVIELNLSVEWGDEVDFENVRKADAWSISPGASLRVGRHLDLELEHTVERLGLDGERIFLANLSDARIVYHFSRRAFLRAIIQYERVSRNVALFSDPIDEDQQELFTQVLFSYKVNPRTVLFAGYSDSREGVTGVPLTATTRSFFLKVGYAWRP